MKNNKAFTLIELMVVICIIAIFAGIIIPSLVKTRSGSNQEKNKTTIENVESKSTNYSPAKFNVGDELFFEKFKILVVVDEVNYVDSQVKYKIVYKIASGEIKELVVSETQLKKISK